MAGYVLKHKRTTLERAEKFISKDEWTDCNLHSRLYKKKAPIREIRHFAASDRISGADGIRNVKAVGKPTELKESFGPTWSTHWFELVLDVPPSWHGEEVVLVWNSEAECLVWREGKPVQGLTNENRRTHYTITNSYTGDSSITLYIEMACNGLFGAGDGSQISPPNPNCTFAVKEAHLAVFNKEVMQLFRDFEVLVGLAKFLPKESNRAYQAMFTANSMINLIVAEEETAYQKAHKLAADFFAQPNGASQHQVVAVGNCHIDSAWLWPYAETIRKCARSFSSTIRLLEKYPEFTFVCSQAQQFEWIEQNYPSLFEEIRKWVKAGRYIPVGGTWVEMDGLMPSGEAFIRQFLYGQRYFMKHFGMKCSEFWLPDTFGYSAQLPQILQLCGCERFVTQKMSWNLVNKFPHNTFWWQGIDGTKVLTHFPPADKYTAEATVEEIVYSLDNFQDKGRSNSSLLLYGWGDGGGGPTGEMIERLHRMADIDGCPKVKIGNPSDFFSEIETHESEKLCNWNGELYLELHNGTYTSQAKTKQKNRQCEVILHRAETLATLATLLSGQTTYRYPAAELLRLWKLVMLNQFHDVLPGSSIHEVYKDALAYYKDVMKSAKQIIMTAIETLLPSMAEQEADTIVFNTLGCNRCEVLSLPSDHHLIGKLPEGAFQIDFTGKLLVMAKVASYGYSMLTPVSYTTVEASKGDDDYIYLSNEYLDVKLDPHGRIVSLYTTASSKNAIADGRLGNQLVVYDDVPLYWDAWDVMDYHLETRKPVKEIVQHAMVIENGPLRCIVEVSFKISDRSLLKQFITLDTDCPYLKFYTEVTWNESHKFLKVEFPLNVLATQATYETQFGWLQRPTHQNTSWDWAKFEVCGHRWADLSEYGWGVSILNDSKYGWSCFGNTMYLSLLRSTKSPDERADMGTHAFTYAIMPHTGSFQEAGVIQAAQCLNVPLDWADSPSTPAPEKNSFMSVDNPAIILDTLKMAEDSNSAYVLRLYEAFGSRCSAKIQFRLPVKQVHFCNGLEEILSSRPLPINSNTIAINFTPFQIVSLKCSY